MQPSSNFTIQGKDLFGACLTGYQGENALPTPDEAVLCDLLHVDKHTLSTVTVGSHWLFCPLKESWVLRQEQSSAQ
jgi:hypothetical protein